MAVEFAPAPARFRSAPISWAAIFASLAVGISVMLLLTLAGVAVGVTVLDEARGIPRAITMGAAAWQTASMLIAALIGGYVAARLSGLRRTGDGVLHGAVSWGATTLLYAVLALTALGTLTAGMFGVLAPGTTERAAGAALSMAAGDRLQAQRTLEGIGLTAEQARVVVDQLAVPPGAGATTGVGAAGETGGVIGTPQQFGQPQFGTPQAATPQSPAAPAQPQQPAFAPQMLQENIGPIGAATAWLAAAVLLSLLLSLAGGAMGVRGGRRVNRRIDQRTDADALAA